MGKLENDQKGFGAVETVLILVIVVLLSIAGLIVYKNQNKESATDKSVASSNTKTKAELKPVEKTDEYAGWKSYSNAEYGFSYRYPTAWTRSDEGKINSAQSASKQEFATGLKLTEERKYNNTAVVEVLNQPLAHAVKFYDDYYAQSSSNQVSKTNQTLKGKDAVTYKVTNLGQESKLYLFAVGSKTYSFASVNEELNVQSDANYWQTFDKVFISLSIN